MSDTMFCPACRQTLPLALFFDAKNGRYLRQCLPCRRALVDAMEKPEPKVRNASLRVVSTRPRENGLRLVRDASVAQSIKSVIDQL